MMNQYLRLDQIKDGEALYHYTKGGSLLNILASRSLFATKSSFLNDTNEMDYIVSVIAEAVDDIDNPEWRSLLKRDVVDTMDLYKRHDTFVLSLSTDRDSITLWAEFGEQTGYSVAFEGKKLIDEIDHAQEIYCHGCCIYPHELQKNLVRSLLVKNIPEKLGICFEDLMKQAVLDHENMKYQEYLHHIHRVLNAYALFFKQEEFAPEKEYRIVFRNPYKENIRYREKEGFLLPYIVIDLSRQKHLPVSLITVAPKNHVDLAKKGMVQYLAQMGYDVPVRLSRLKLRY